MTKRSFIATLPLVSGLGAMAAEGPKTKELKDHPYLSPESCSQADPDTRWSESQRDEAFRREFGWSEQAQTAFFQVYAPNLRKWTDEKHPQSLASRPHVEKAFYGAMRFINDSVWGVRIHFLPRFPARMEWIIWQGYHEAFDTSEAQPRYKLEDIRTLLEILFRANAEVYKKFEEERQLIDESLSELQQAEAFFPEAGRRYFRAQLAKLVAEALVNT